MEVRPGYKQTEVGVIPEEWDESRRLSKRRARRHIRQDCTTDYTMQVVPGVQPMAHRSMQIRTDTDRVTLHRRQRGRERDLASIR